MTKTRPLQKTCIFGGAFDPIHAGHLKIVEKTGELLSIDRFVWVPTYKSPHKRLPETPYRHRLKMVRLALAGKKNYSVSSIESRLPQPSYTLNTIASLKKQYGGHNDWYFLMGADNWIIFKSWYKWEEVLNTINILIFPRAGYEIKNLPGGAQLIKTRLWKKNSTTIRGKLRNNISMEKAGILPEIKNYIKIHHLYQQNHAQ